LEGGFGKDGPIFNPQNIRYLGPGDAGYPALPSSVPIVPNFSGLAAGLAGVNLMVSLGNLALSAVIYKEVKQLSKKMDEAHFRILGKLDDIYDRVRVIDIKVQENNLREAINHLSRACVVDNAIDLMEIKKIEGDVRRFLDTVEDYGYVRGRSFELSYDVREKLISLHSVLYATREIVGTYQNQNAGGNPSNVLVMHPVQDYRPNQMVLCDNPIPEAEVTKVFNELHDEIAHLVKDSAGMKEWVWSRFGAKHPADQCKDRINQTVETIQQMLTKLDNHILPAPQKEASWLWNSDMGLLWRVHKELRALGNYQQEFTQWRRLEGRPLGSEQLLIDCSWDASPEFQTA
jgi:Mg2+ and Co2+ transporter CorA